jgi:hypothetical protein
MPHTLPVLPYKIMRVGHGTLYMYVCMYVWIYIYIYIYILRRIEGLLFLSFLNSVMAAGQCCSSGTATLILCERASDNHWKRGWLGSRTGKRLERRKISCPLPDPIIDTSPHIFCRLCNNGSTDTHVRQNYAFQEDYGVVSALLLTLHSRKS